MTTEELYTAWLLIDQWAKEDGVSPAQVRERIKAAIAKRWEDEEKCGIRELQTLHNRFSAPPSAEAALTFMLEENGLA